MKKIGFLGAGAMGIRMIQQLLQSGFQVTAWNRTKDALTSLNSIGVVIADTPKEVAENADVVFSMVTDNEASKSVWLDSESGAIKGLKPGAIAVECSTLTPGWVKELANTIMANGNEFVDAPLAGSRPQAEAAKLIFFVGASDSAFDIVSPVLASMGAAIHHAGPVTTGAKIKLAVNAMFGLQLAGMAELLGYLSREGVDTKVATEIIGSTPVCSLATKISAEAMVKGLFSPAFPIQLVVKDLNYVLSSANTVNADLPLGRAVTEVFETANNEGFGENNITGVAQLYF